MREAGIVEPLKKTRDERKGGEGILQPSFSFASFAQPIKLKRALRAKIH